MQEPTDLVAAGDDANDPRYAPALPQWGIAAMRSRLVLINLDLVFPRDPGVSPSRAVSGVNMTRRRPGRAFRLDPVRHRSLVRTLPVHDALLGRSG